MMGFGMLMMLFVLGLPILLIAAVLIWVLGLEGWRRRQIFSSPTPASLVRQDARYCSHCGQGLQADWTHCPKCGAPISE